MTDKNYNNMVGLILYSGNPFAIRKMHEIIDCPKGDALRREIIATKYTVSTMTETQRIVFQRIAEGTFTIARSSFSEGETPLQYTTQIEFYHDMHRILRREVEVPMSSNIKAWYAIDEENNIAFRCNLTNVEIMKNKIYGDEPKVPPVMFCENLNISKLFYYMCCSIDYRNNECNKIEEVQAAYEFQDQIANLYKR